MRAFCPVLKGGPYDVHVLTVTAEVPPPYLRFAEAPRLDVWGKPSVCAPDVIDQGDVEYRLLGLNVMEQPIYEFVWQANGQMSPGGAQ